MATASAIDTLLSVRDFVANVDWQNGPDAIRLYNSLGEIADALQYGDAGAHNRGEGVAALDAPAGFALTRDALGTDSGDNKSDFSISAPTPGARLHAVAIPEPSTLALILLAGWTALRRPGGNLRPRSRRIISRRGVGT